MVHCLTDGDPEECLACHGLTGHLEADHVAFGRLGGGQTLDYGGGNFAHLQAVPVRFLA